MSKKDLAQQLAYRTGLTTTQAATAIDGLMLSMLNSFVSGKNIYLRGFGTFKVEQRAEKKARIIATGETVTVPSHRTVKFIPCSTLKNQLK